MAEYIVSDTNLTLIADAIREKGGTSASLEFPDEFISAIEDIETGSSGGSSSTQQNDVKFIDYDGTVLFRYAINEFQELSAMPPNPVHEGLTSQGWNWTLADAKAQLTAMPDAGLTIGQMYITDDGKTRIYCRFDDMTKSPFLQIAVNGTVVVDWGDGSSTDTITGTSLDSTATYIQHQYTTSGEYVIQLTVTNGEIAFLGNQTSSYIFRRNTTSNNNNEPYLNCIRSIQLGLNASMNRNSFRCCRSLASITIPNGATRIASASFINCPALSSITIPSSVTSIGDGMFTSCASLSLVAIPNSVTSIGASAFSYCYSISHITIPSGVTSISYSAFQHCVSLSSIILPDGITSLEHDLFSFCQSLSSINIPDGVTSIENGVFSSCCSLSSVVIPSGVTKFGNSAFSGCTALSSITIPENVKAINTTVFSNCSSLSSITIPNGVTSIGSQAFNGCYSLSSVTIPDGVISIESNAFTNCQSISHITIPSSVTSIATSAFSGSRLFELHFRGTTPPTVASSNAFYSLPTDCVIYVPAGSIEAYTTATNYPSSSTYTYIEE